MEETASLVFNKVAESGIFAIFFLLLLVAIGYAIWVLGKRVLTSYEKNMGNIVESNSRFAESSEKMVDLVGILVEQTEFTSNQLGFIKKTIQKQNSIIVECVNLLKSISKEDKEFELKLNNILKEAQRPLD